MKNNIGKRIVSALLCALTAIGLGGCSNKEEVICGGITDKTDRSAPKTIESKEISDFYARIFLVGEWAPGTESSAYTFSIEPNSAGVLIASEETTGASYKADSELLTALQNIIDEERLADNNGVYRTTAGLPPEFQPCRLTVNYASGEKLYFTVNNDPHALWEQKVYLAFANWFEIKGIDSLQPPKSEDKIVALDFKVTENGAAVYYNNVENLIIKNMYDENNNKLTDEKSISIPEDYFDKITEIVAKYELRPFDNSSALYGMGRNIKNENANHASLQLYIAYSDESVIDIITSDENDIKLLAPLVADLKEYHELLFTE